MEIELLGEYLFYDEEVIVIDIYENMRMVEVVMKSNMRRVVLDISRLNPIPPKEGFLKRLFKW